MKGYANPTMCFARNEAGLREALEKGGWRCTRQRAAVYNFLAHSDSHPTAEEVYSVVRSKIPKISLATVYKALEALVECRLANKLTAGDGPARYDADQGDHYHLRCLRTGRVQDMPTSYDPDLIRKIDPGLIDKLRAQGFQVTGYRLEVLGQFEEA